MKKQHFILFAKIFLLMFVIGFISSRLLFHANKDAIHYDEPIFIERGIFLDYYLKRDFKQSFWTSYVAYDVPKLGEFIYGAGLRAYYRQPVAEVLMNYNFLDERIGNQGSEWYRAYTGDPDMTLDKLSPKIRQKFTPVLAARKEAVLFSVLGLLLIFAVGYLVDGWLYGLASVALLGFRPLFINIGSKAIGDPPLLLFLIAYLFSSLMLVKVIKNKQNKKQNILLALCAVLVGLAIAIKLNAIISLLHLVLTYLFLRKINGYSVHQTSAKIIYLLAVSFGVFAVLNPLVWDNPIKRSVEMALYRANLFKKQQTLFAMGALPNIALRLKAVFTKRFPDLLILVLTGLGYFLFAKTRGEKIIKQFNIKKVIQQAKSKELWQKRIVFGLWLLLNVTITTLIIPLDWDRYYLPILLAVVYLEAAVVKKLAILIYSYFNKLVKS